ncbi:MAG: helix-turn-helix domain-containing protein [Clostridia bacterium]|nr:helix-turn-helix domain-containing protein [Clostridia bacterium]
MAEKKVGALVKEARTAAGLTQEKLAKEAGEGLSAADISRCERGEADLTAAQLKKIAVACGVTQKSLLEAPKNLKAAAKKTDATASSAKTTAAKKTDAKASSAKTTSSKKTDAKASSAKTTAAKKTDAKASSAKTAAAKKTEAKAAPAGANTSMKVTATEKKLIEAYREAPTDLKKAALKLLKGEYGDTVNTLLGASSGSGATAADGIGEMLGGLLGNLLGGK